MKPSDLQKLLDAATQGPWTSVQGEFGYRWDGDEWGTFVGGCSDSYAGSQERDVNVDLITTARNILPLLLQLWDASVESVEMYGYCSDYQDPMHRLAVALAALDQYGEDGK